jgi:toxin-antitoxin system PIN domain toxin
MLAVDSNILVYAHRRETKEHSAAAEVLASLAAGAEPWAIPWPCVYEFFSIVTNVRIWKEAASTPEQAWLQLAAWFDSPALRLLGETGEFLEVLSGIVRRPRVRGPVIHDARVAAICLAHGVTKLLTRDRDFRLFPELLLEDPLA